MKKVIYVVEGQHDIAKLKQIDPFIEAISVNGSAIDEKALDLLKKYQKTHDIVLLTDPDYSGELIRRYLEQQLDQVHHIFIDRKDAFSPNHKKIGVEHVEHEHLKQALSSYRKTVNQKSTSDVTQSDLYNLGLVGQKQSKHKREQLSNYLKLGHINGKTLLKRIHLFDISLIEIMEALSCSTK
jgi:ribonuclease M5